MCSCYLRLNLTSRLRSYAWYFRGMSIPDYVRQMVRRPAPTGCSVIPGTTPVVSFGNPTRAKVATLGINPSKSEFLDKSGAMLTKDKQRLATLPSLGASRCEELTDAQVLEVVRWCNRYFQGNWYKRWFQQLEKHVLPPSNLSYLDGSVCHLDLVQWATDPVWQLLEQKTETKRLMDEGVEHLRAQLETESIKTVVVLGRGVWDQIEKTGLADFEDVETITISRGRAKSTLRIGSGCGAKFLGWTSNIQSQPGITNEDRVAFGTWLADNCRSS